MDNKKKIAFNLMLTKPGNQESYHVIKEFKTLQGNIFEDTKMQEHYDCVANKSGKTLKKELTANSNLFLLTDVSDLNPLKNEEFLALHISGIVVIVTPAIKKTIINTFEPIFIIKNKQGNVLALQEKPILVGLVVISKENAIKVNAKYYQEN